MERQKQPWRDPASVKRRCPGRDHHAPGAAYRPDIDGLRAVAVLAVVLFHAGMPGLGGGFVGVDIFFVISGYLITGNVAREIEAGRFTIAGFYVRRARRIVPALAVMLAATAIAAAVWLTPADMARFGISLVAAALSVSNIHFWSEAGYFDVAAGQKPLLHTWSLSVEEQFYLLLPLGLVLLARRRIGFAPVLASVAVASLAISILSVRFAPTAGFFLLPSRIWELLFGSLLSLGALPVAKSRAPREAMAVAGLAAILVALLAFDPSTPFPGAAALLPCLGAGFLIAAGESGGLTLVGRLLSLRPMVVVGLISYSLYLWHWPLIVLASYRFGPSTALSIAAVVAASLVLAALSWRFVEQPFRRGFAASAPAVLVASAASIGGLAALGTAIIMATGSPAMIERLYGSQIAAVNRMVLADHPRGACEDLLLTDMRERGCLVGAAGVEPSVAVFGDSFAEAIVPSLGEVLARRGRSVAPYVYFSCPSIRGAARSEALAWAPGFVKDCRDYVEAATAEILADPSIDQVVIGNNFDWYLNRPSTVTGGPVLTADGADAAGNRSVLLQRIGETIATFARAGKTVIFLGTSPSGHDAYGASAVMRALRAGGKVEDGALPMQNCIDATRDIGEKAEAAYAERFTYIDLRRFFVHATQGGERCAMTADGLPLTTDGSHLSVLLAPQVADAIAAVVTAQSVAVGETRQGDGSGDNSRFVLSR